MLLFFRPKKWFEAFSKVAERQSNLIFYHFLDATWPQSSLEWKGSVTQHQSAALINQRKALFCFALHHFHLIHVDSQSGNREGYIPVYKWLIVAFLEAKLGQSGVSSEL